MTPLTGIGTRYWNDEAEKSEWRFMAKMMREAKDLLPRNLSGLDVAIDIADARAKSGWRTAPDNDFAPDQAAEIERLREGVVEREAELIYLRLHGKDGALWSANHSKSVWLDKARVALDLTHPTPSA